MKMFKIKENELYQELALYDDETQIGECEVEMKSKQLSRLVIYEPYQNKGYGTQVVQMLTKYYGCDNLWVNSDNERAMHVYEKCGYKRVKPAMYLMERE